MMGVVYLQVCPICAIRVGVDMVAHITLLHGNVFKISFSTVLLFIIMGLSNNFVASLLNQFLEHH